MKTKKRKPLKIIISIFIFILVFIILFFLINITYLYCTFKRIPDKQNLETTSCQTQTYENRIRLQNGIDYTGISYNIGFSAYIPKFSFFMDGGTESWAFSKEDTINDTNNIANFLKEQDADFIALQEVDSNSDRTYHVNEVDMIRNQLADYSNVTACCYDSSFLFWPPWQPHGKSVSNLMTLSKFNPKNPALRRQLPIDEGFSAIKDYDRCYSIQRYETDNGKELVWYTTHMSAYSDDPTTSNKQIEMLIKDMQHEFDNGNYVICAADFNKQIVQNPQNYFSVPLVEDTKPFPYEYLQGKNINLVAPFNESEPVGSCRSAECPLESTTPVSNIDGFLVSSNIIIDDTNVINTNFEYSDHNPVYIKFRLI